MIRERVSVLGIPRPMEPASEMPSIPTEQVGLIKEAPVRRWLNGLDEWDHKFSHTAKKVRKERERNEVEARVILDSFVKEQEESGVGASIIGETGNKGAQWVEEKRYGPLDLSGEFPPPSAICGRRDTVKFLFILSCRPYSQFSCNRPTPSFSSALQSITLLKRNSPYQIRPKWRNTQCNLSYKASPHLRLLRNSLLPNNRFLRTRSKHTVSLCGVG